MPANIVESTKKKEFLCTAVRYDRFHINLFWLDSIQCVVFDDDDDDDRGATTSYSL